MPGNWCVFGLGEDMEDVVEEEEENDSGCLRLRVSEFFAKLPPLIASLPLMFGVSLLYQHPLPLMFLALGLKI